MAHLRNVIVSGMIITILTLSLSTGSSITNNSHSNSKQQSKFLWKSFIEISDKTLEKAFLPSYIDWNVDLFQNENISSICKAQFNDVFQGFKQRRTWAFKMFNSWAQKVPPGAMIGTMTDYGDYDQCLSIDEVIIPQYCLIDIAFPMPEPMPEQHNLNNRPDRMLIPYPNETININNDKRTIEFVSDGSIYRHLANFSSMFYYLYIRMGICVPNNCSNNDIRSIVLKGLKETGLNLKTLTCSVKNTEKWKPNLPQTVAIISLIFLLSITLFAALYDRVVTKKSKTLSETILLWFSPIKNIQKLICTKSNEELSCIHGIRFITLVWIIIGHTLEWNPMNIFRESFLMTERMSSLEYQPLLKAHYSVDTFFYVSGLLTSYVTFKYTRGDYQKFHYLPYILLRYLRLTPQLMAFMLILSLMPSMYDGPLWMDYMNKVINKCSITWWHNLIYMQNMIDVKNICAIHTWYLGADMQLHWMSVILIAMLLKYPNKGILFTKCLILVCMSVGVVTILIQRLPPGGVITNKNDFLDEFGTPSDFLKFFYAPWNHANVFFIGFIFGSRLHNNNWKNLILTKKRKYLYWLLAFSGYLFCIYSTSPWLYGRPYNPVWSAILFPLNRTIWALILTLVIWLCLTNNGTIIGRLLSWSGFRPLSRMTYSVYLTHVLVFYVALGSRRNLVDNRMTTLMSLLVSSIIISYFIGFIFTVLVEAPLIHFLEYLKNNLFVIHTNNNNNNNDQNIKLPNNIQLITIDEKKEILNNDSNV